MFTRLSDLGQIHIGTQATFPQPATIDGNHMGIKWARWAPMGHGLEMGHPCGTHMVWNWYSCGPYFHDINGFWAGTPSGIHVGRYGFHMGPLSPHLHGMLVGH